MKKKFLQNISEGKTKAIIEPVLEAFGDRYLVHPEVGMAAVIEPKSFPERSREWSHVLNGRFDFLVCKRGEPIFAVEFDGPVHENNGRMQKDQLKNRICELAELPLMRISHRHLEEIPKDLGAFYLETSAPATFLKYSTWFLATYLAFEDMAAKTLTSGGGTRGVEALRSVQERLLGPIAPLDDAVLAFGSSEAATSRGYLGPVARQLKELGGISPDIIFRRTASGIASHSHYKGKEYSSRTDNIELYGVPHHLEVCIALSYQERNIFAQIGLENIEWHPDRSIAGLEEMVRSAIPENLLDSGSIELMFHREFSTKGQRKREQKSRELKDESMILDAAVLAPRGLDSLLYFTDEEIHGLIKKYDWGHVPRDN